MRGPINLPQYTGSESPPNGSWHSGTDRDYSSKPKRVEPGAVRALVTSVENQLATIPQGNAARRRASLGRHSALSRRASKVRPSPGSQIRAIAEMTLNFAVEAAWALNRTRLEMEAGGQQTRVAAATGHEKKVRRSERTGETGGRWLSGRMTAIGIKPRPRASDAHGSAARTKSGALPRCCGKAHAHLAKLNSGSHTGRRIPREGSRSAIVRLRRRQASGPPVPGRTSTGRNPRP